MTSFEQFLFLIFIEIIFPGGAAVKKKNLPAVQETWVQSLGEEDPLEKGMATHSSILAWEIPWTDSPWGHKELDTTERLTHIEIISIESFLYAKRWARHFI